MLIKHFIGSCTHTHIHRERETTTSRFLRRKKNALRPVILHEFCGSQELQNREKERSIIKKKKRYKFEERKQPRFKHAQRFASKPAEGRCAQRHIPPHIECCTFKGVQCKCFRVNTLQHSKKKKKRPSNAVPHNELLQHHKVPLLLVVFRCFSSWRSKTSLKG